MKDPLKSQDHLHHHKKQERENGLDDTEVIVEIEQEGWQEEQHVYLHTDSKTISFMKIHILPVE